MMFDGVDPAWSFRIVDRNGQPAQATMRRTGTGLVASFRPPREHHVEGQIGDYYLVIEVPKGAKPGAFRVSSKLDVETRTEK